MSVRTFIAVDIGPMDELVSFEDQISKTGAEVKLVEPENIHITLKFLGDTSEDLVDDILEMIRQSCSGIKGFRLEFCGAGRHEEHVAVSQQILSPVGVDDGPRIGFGRHLKRQPGREVGLYDAGQYIHRGPLGR